MDEPVEGPDGKLHHPNCIVVQQGEINWAKVIECTWLMDEPCAKENNK